MKYTDEEITFIKTLKETSGLTWEEIIEAFELQFDRKITYCGVRNCYRRYINTQFKTDVTDKLILDRRRLQTNNQRLNREKNVILDQRLSDADFIDSMFNLLKGVKFKKHKSIKFNSNRKTERVIVSVISDLHLGITVDPNEVNGSNSFNPEIAARRLGLLTDTICNYKLNHRKETKLVVILNGDLIAGVIHDSKNIDLMTKQTTMLYSYLVQMFTYLERFFNKIEIHSIPGNHDRFTHKKNSGRQTEEKYDCFQNIVLSCIKDQLDKGVIKIYKSPAVVIDILGHSFLATHGDTVINAGNVSKSLNMKNIINQINAYNVSYIKKENKTLSGVILGHYHTSFNYVTDEGVNIIGNGCLSGLDPFANSIGIFSSCPAQTIFEATQEHPVGDLRIVKLNIADKQEKYNSIIETFKKDSIFE